MNCVTKLRQKCKRTLTIYKTASKEKCAFDAVIATCVKGLIYRNCCRNLSYASVAVQQRAQACPLVAQPATVKTFDGGIAS